jgi:hypothetical protein
MTQPYYVDPIAHAWRHCNPRAPLPPLLVRAVAPSGLAPSLTSSQGQLMDEGSRTRQEEVRHGFVTVAIAPLISPADGAVSGDGGIGE